MVGTSFASLEGWETDLAKAKELAKKEKKSVLVEFTGSDWCPPCIHMRKEVFSKQEFVNQVKKNYVLVELDFPKKDAELAKKNRPLAEEYKIDGYPTIILLDSEGKEFSRFTASEYPDIDSFVKALNDRLEKKDLD